MAFNSTFRKLSLTERQVLLDSGTHLSFKPGDVIVRQGERLNGIYVVVHGEVRIEHGIQVVRQTVVKHKDGRDSVKEIPGRLSVEVTRLGRGAIFGEMSFVDDSPTSASVCAAGEVEVVFVDGGKVRVMLEEDPSFAARFYHSLAIVLSERLRDANRQARGNRPRAALPSSARPDGDADQPASPEASDQAPGVQR